MPRQLPASSGLSPIDETLENPTPEMDERSKPTLAQMNQRLDTFAAEFKEDEETTKIKAFMAFVEEEPSVGKADARSGQWVEITMKKVKENQEKDKIGSKPDKNRKRVEAGKSLKQLQTKSPDVPVPQPENKVDLSAKQLLLTLMDEVKSLKEQIKVLSDKSSFVLQTGSSKSSKGKQTTWFGPLLLMNLLTVLRSTPTAGNQGLLTSDPHNPLKSRHMTEVKQYLHKYSKESSPKVVFRDNSSGDTERYGLVNCNGITFTRVAYVNGLKHNLIIISQLCDANFKVLFTKTHGTIFNQNDEVFLIALRRKDVYVIDMSSYNEESNACFVAKASPSVNWLWH
nr:retrovirus-related Pol polyprotein from transposon TNT 1-94 [Tanacetum cinerariifolium]